MPLTRLGPAGPRHPLPAKAGRGKRRCRCRRRKPHSRCHRPTRAGELKASGQRDKLYIAAPDPRCALPSPKRSRFGFAQAGRRRGGAWHLRVL